MWDLLKDDWNKIPQNIRYIIYIGVALVFNSWFLDHWIPNQKLPYEYLGHFDIRTSSYNIGQSLILIAIILIIVKQLLNLRTVIINYKVKYPIKDVGIKFDLIWFNGRLMLFDHKNKSYYHIYPWETAEDLGFVSYGVHVQEDFPSSKSLKVKIGNRTLDTSDYKNGGSINTRK